MMHLKSHLLAGLVLSLSVVATPGLASEVESETGTPSLLSDVGEGKSVTTNGYRWNGFRWNGFRWNGYRWNGAPVDGFEVGSETSTYLSGLAEEPLAR